MPPSVYCVTVSNVGTVCTTNDEYQARFEYREWCQAVVSTKAARFIGEEVSLHKDDQLIDSFLGVVGEWSTNPFKSIATVAEALDKVERVEEEMEFVTSWVAIDPDTFLATLLGRIALATDIRCHSRKTDAGFEWMAYIAS